jgi:hypothetical protein
MNIVIREDEIFNGNIVYTPPLCKDERKVSAGRDGGFNARDGDQLLSLGLLSPPTWKPTWNMLEKPAASGADRNS